MFSSRIVQSLADCSMRCESGIRTMSAICWERHVEDVRDILLAIVVVLSCALQLSTTVTLFRKPAANCRRWAGRSGVERGGLVNCAVCILLHQTHMVESTESNRSLSFTGRVPAPKFAAMADHALAPLHVQPSLAVHAVFICADGCR